MALLGSYLSRKNILFFSLFVAFCLFIFKDIIIGGHLLFGSDFIAFYMGMKQFLYNELHANHSIPFWNPYLFGGIPFWAHFESSIFYPLAFLFWLLPPIQAYGYTMFLHLLLAGYFMFMLARSFGISRAGSFVAGAVFMCNGFIMSTLYLGRLNPVQSYIWLPIVVYFLNRALTSKTPYFSASIAGALWGVQILAGAPQDAFYTFLASLLFLVYSIKGGLKANNYGINLVIIAFLLFLFGVAVAAIQLVPSFEFIGESVRATLDRYKMVTMASYPPEGIISSIMPHFFGNYVKDNFWVSNVPWSIPQSNLYVGILPIILLFFVAYRNPDNKKVIIFAGSLAIIAFVLALGRHTPVYKLAYLFPGFDKFRSPSKIIVLWVFALGLLAGKGLDDLLRDNRTPRLRRSLTCMFLLISLVGLDALFHFDRSIILKFFSPFILDEAIPHKLADASNIIVREFHRFTLLSAFILFSILLWNRRFLNYTFACIMMCGLLLVDLSYANWGALGHGDVDYVRLKRMK